MRRPPACEMIPLSRATRAIRPSDGQIGSLGVDVERPTIN